MRCAEPTVSRSGALRGAGRCEVPCAHTLDRMRLLVYTVLRLLIVLAAAGLLYWVGMRSWVLWITALVVGALVSFLVLGKQRDAAVQVLAERDPARRPRPRFSPTVEADAAYEDAIVDAGTSPPHHPAADRAPAEPGGSERETEPEQHAVTELEQPGVPQDHDEVAPDGTTEHDAREAHRRRREQQDQ